MIKKLTKSLKGKRVSCVIQGVAIEDARIQIDNNRVFICQNLKSGRWEIDKLGYKYAWVIGRVGDEGFSEGGHETAFLRLGRPKPFILQVRGLSVHEKDLAEEKAKALGYKTLQDAIRGFVRLMNEDKVNIWINIDDKD